MTKPPNTAVKVVQHTENDKEQGYETNNFYSAWKKVNVFQNDINVPSNTVIEIKGEVCPQKSSVMPLQRETW